MCDCKNIVPSSKECYEQQVLLTPPKKIAEERSSRGLWPKVCIDPCIVEEVEMLWDLGIETTGCCCGHSTMPGYIGVSDDCITSMIDLGYTVQHNPNRPYAKDTFNLMYP